MLPSPERRRTVTRDADRGRVRILAHRGSPGPGTTENTLPALRRAWDTADGAEVDLRLTADGVLAVCHDPDLGRITGRGTDLAIAGTRWEDLRTAAAAYGVPLARVEDVLAAAEGRPLVLELKAAPEEVAHVLARLLRTRGEEVTVSSFDPALVRVVRERCAVRTALLGRPGTPFPALLRRALDAGHDQVHPHVSDLLAQPHVVAAAGSVGVGVVPWTVTSRRDLRRCALLGVQAVITDAPRAARDVLSARRAVA